jgi:hypothetical protein
MTDEPIIARTIQHRYRISTSQTAKGTITWDCTVEMYGDSPDEALKESDHLVEQLNRRYPKGSP